MYPLKTNLKMCNFHPNSLKFTIAFAGRYGMAVMTYFRFVKWLMFLNFYIMVITFGILVIPYAAMNSSGFDDYVRNKSSPDLNVTSRDYRMIMEAVNCTQQYTRHMDKVHGAVHTSATLFLDLIQGTVSTPDSLPREYQ
jgi:hypothetical protein